MPRFIHTVRREANEPLFPLPDPKDPRVSCMLDRLIELGVMSKEGKSLKPLRAGAGIVNGAFMWSFEWEEDEDAQ